MPVSAAAGNGDRVAWTSGVEVRGFRHRHTLITKSADRKGSALHYPVRSAKVSGHEENYEFRRMKEDVGSHERRTTRSGGMSILAILIHGRDARATNTVRSLAHP